MRIEREMEELLLRYLRGQTTEDENRSVEAWRNKSPDAGRELNDLRLLVEAGRAADLEVDPGDAPPAQEVIWRAEARVADAARRRRVRRARSRPTSSRLGFFAGWATAAAAVAAALAIYASSRPPGPTGSGALAAQEFITAPGETALVHLGDGSVIRLGPASRLSTPAGEFARTVTLEGTAFFSIAHDEAQSFRVTTAAGSARVLGTRFLLATEPDELRIVVVEGRIALGAADLEVQVGAGQTTSLIEGRPGPVLDAPAIEVEADWLDDFLIFQDTPLARAMQEVERRYGTEVEVADPVLLNRTLTMWFTSKTLEEVMTVVCSVIDARCSIEDGIVRMGSRNGGATR